jgi:hypothetical protein
MSAHVQREYLGARVLTVWPSDTELSQPEFGYVRTPVKTVAFRLTLPTTLDYRLCL